VVRFPEVVEDAVWSEETQGICAYATALATEFHAFYRDARVIDQEAPERSAERLALATATKTTLAAALGLLGISAPESM
jgi:arginyl-tRNA synthetase